MVRCDLYSEMIILVEIKPVEPCDEKYNKFDSLLFVLNFSSPLSSGSVSVVFVRYDSIGDILKPSSDPGVTDYSRYAETGEITVNSQVIAAAVKPADVYQLDHVTFTLRHNEVNTAHC